MKTTVTKDGVDDRVFNDAHVRVVENRRLLIVDDVTGMDVVAEIEDGDWDSVTTES